MKVVIVSYTHGSFYELKKIIAAERPFDVLVHCGDICGELQYALGERRDYHLRAVGGNCDYEGNLPKELVFLLGDYHRVYLSHGDLLNVRRDNRNLVRMAKQNGCDIAMYGHTHVPEVTEEEGVTVINPGSPVRPRGGSQPSYAVMEIEDGTGKLAVLQKELP